jgi:hypothetical protein
MGIYVKTAADEWTRLGAGSGGGGGGTSWGDWTIVDTPDEADTWSAPDSQGRIWKYVAFNTAGDYTINLTGGMYWVLAVGGGSNGWDNRTGHDQGQPGSVTEGYWEFGSGTQTVTVGDRALIGANVMPGWSGIGERISGYGTQGGGQFGWEGAGRGGITGDADKGYFSNITGNLLEYAPAGGSSSQRPGKGSSSGVNDTALPGCVIIATPTNVEQITPAPPRLDVAPVISAPVKVSGSADVAEYSVLHTDGKRRKIYFLPGNTTANTEDNVFEVTLGAGVLPGMMIASGGQGGNYSTNRGGPGGAGGVIGQGAKVPVILPVQGEQTYTITVPSPTTGSHAWHPMNGRDCTIAVKGAYPFAVAVGGGKGTASQNGNADQPGKGGSGGGSGNWNAPEPDATPGYMGYASGGEGIEGQGFPGGDAYGGPYIGGGGGYSERGHREVGGKGFDLVTALSLDTSDGSTAMFLDAVTDEGYVAGGGSFTLNGFETFPGGGGGRSGTMSNGQDYTGGGGSGGDTTAHPGGCGAVYIITDDS